MRHTLTREQAWFSSAMAGNFLRLCHARTLSETRGFVKALVEADSGKSWPPSSLR
jgi:hypothetical protein